MPRLPGTVHNGRSRPSRTGCEGGERLQRGSRRMADILRRIMQTKREELARATVAVPLAELQARLADAPPVRDFFAAVSAPGAVRVIAEVKKASPSKGVIRADFDPVAIARIYAAEGAAAPAETGPAAEGAGPAAFTKADEPGPAAEAAAADAAAPVA